MASAVAHAPLELWLSAIPVAGGVVIAYITYLLNLRRDRLALQRDDERRRVDDERLALRVSTDLAFRLNRQRYALREAAHGGGVDRLAAEHAALVRRAAETDVIDVLGHEYLPFMSLLQHGEATLARLEAHVGSARPATQVDRGAEFITLAASLDAYARRFAQPDARGR